MKTPKRQMLFYIFMRNEMRYRQNINQATDLNNLDIFFARIDVLYLFFYTK